MGLLKKIILGGIFLDRIGEPQITSHRPHILPFWAGGGQKISVNPRQKNPCQFVCLRGFCAFWWPIKSV